MPDPVKQQALVDHLRELEEEDLESLRRRYYGDSPGRVKDTANIMVHGEDPNVEVEKLRQQQYPRQSAALLRADAGSTYRDAVRAAAREADARYRNPGNK